MMNFVVFHGFDRTTIYSFVCQILWCCIDLDVYNGHCDVGCLLRFGIGTSYHDVPESKRYICLVDFIKIEFYQIKNFCVISGFE